MMQKKVKMQKGVASFNTTPYSILCPGQDLNLHTLAGASPSSWCVYQFHHLGELCCYLEKSR
jgi:hypothetical protein